MQFDMTIPASAFKEGYLKVLSAVKLNVVIVMKNGAENVSFVTDTKQTQYDLPVSLSDVDHVEVTLVPGGISPFYPIVQAH
ncbi:Hypothetical protein Tpal_836 [Trichococcus palustris]|jgi:uncharacterized protein|uniref:Uncharacterized protein n=1 Tax=Trichococcus palustris TaxID=140314 RepID=A0A143YFB2_9LACT|nr:hypothetical protein [Trichococcus palustris]CZQ86983.1 Hypothetical protein Tpal_836 [Trichococcus palustris]SFK80152.1 hypothetical protein SAMN04488076_105124 [Trichococcus palustris]